MKSMAWSGILCGLWVCMGAGCATTPEAFRTYAGPARALPQIARVSYPASCQIASIDGITASQMRGLAETTELEFLPGDHTISILRPPVREDSTQTVDAMAFKLEAGRRYRIETRPLLGGLHVALYAAGSDVPLAKCQHWDINKLP